MEQTKILLFDIETAPILGHVWGMRETDVIAKERDWFMLCFAYKWLGEKKVTVKALPDFKGYKKNKLDDEALVTALWELFDKADIIVAHNGDSFDIKKANARFIKHCLPVPSPYLTFDTLKAARRVASFPSNKLDNIGLDLGIGRKLPHTGIHLWLSCMAGDKESWALMKRYNAQDVVLLEKVYLKLRGWSKHPNVNLTSRRPQACPKCSSPHIQSRGFHYNHTSERHQYQCMNCLGWCYGPWEKIASRVHIK